MQIVSLGDNLHEMSELIFCEIKKKKNIANLSSTELAQRVVKVNIHALCMSTDPDRHVHLQSQVQCFGPMS